MSAAALGAYLIVIREARGITAKAVAEAIGSTPTHVWRIEQGVTKAVSAELLHRYIHVIRAGLADVHTIVLDAEMTIEDGIRLAQRLLASEKLPGSDLTAQASDDAVRAALRDLEGRLSLGQRRQWLRLGLVLLDEPAPKRGEKEGEGD